MHTNLTKMIDRCLVNTDIGFEIFYSVSDNTWRFWDISHIEDRLGRSPEENSEQFRQ